MLREEGDLHWELGDAEGGSGGRMPLWAANARIKAGVSIPVTLHTSRGPPAQGGHGPAGETPEEAMKI